MRKIIQLVGVGSWLLALCNDGTVLKYDFETDRWMLWDKSVPQNEPGVERYD